VNRMPSKELATVERRKRYASTTYRVRCEVHGRLGIVTGAAEAGRLVEMHRNGTACRWAYGMPEVERCESCNTSIGVDDGLCSRCRRKKDFTS
jgi:hypothetical protein